MMAESVDEMVRHVFVLNPTAGRTSGEEALVRQIGVMGNAFSHELYVTKVPGDATAFVRDRCLTAAGEIRFYACGGDGTLNEVINGAVGCPQASVACWPCGSGNDYVKYFGAIDSFLDLDALIHGREKVVDLMQVNGDRYAINMVHFGLDSTVAETIRHIKRWPLIGGKRAYYVGALKAFITSVRNSCQVSVDGERLGGDAALLCTIACGQYVGGSFKSSPMSDNADGLLDVCLVKPISRLRIPGLIGLYKSGQHLHNPKLQHDLIYRRGKSVAISAPEGFALLLDGEIVSGTDFQVDVVPRALRFVVPRGL
ncbi:MAG: diacylglycerol/lipid kinase family protein [Christensenellales bacterium]|jgi:diacylglycerol kinase (ATP)